MDNDWYGQTIETPTTPLVDSGTGRPLFLRTFEFAIEPGQKRRPSEQELFNSHWPHMKTLIWSDGLIANEDVAPRVVIGKTRYRIFILCEPRFRQMVIDRPKTLQQIMSTASVAS